MALLKKATAIVNKEFGLDEKLANAIIEASDEVMYYCCTATVTFDFIDLTRHFWITSLFTLFFFFLVGVLFKNSYTPSFQIGSG